jgi:hypothetical protein
MQDCRVKKLLAVLILAIALPAASASADTSTFSEIQSPDDQLYHVDVNIARYGIGTIKVSLPGSSARFDPVLQIDQTGYTCQVTTSAYGEENTGFVCSTDAVPSPQNVTVHLLSQECYAPPSEGSAQPAITQVWAASADPGTPPDASFPLYADVDCSGSDEPPVDNFSGARCVVPKLKGVTLRTAKRKLTRAGCKAGKVTYVASRKVKKGRVVKQATKAGRKLKLGAKVKLLVSRGPKK